MRECLKKNIGYSICPEISVRRELSDGSLRKLNWVGDPMETSVIMIWHAEKWRSPLLKRFMGLSKEMIGQVGAVGNSIPKMRATVGAMSMAVTSKPQRAR